MQANAAALIAALFFGIVVFPWKEAVGRVGTGGVFITLGTAYILYGLFSFWLDPLKGPLNLSDIGFAALVGIFDLCAIAAFNYAMAHPAVDLPVASALVGVAPLFTLIVAVLVLRQPVSFKEGFFIILTVMGIWGLSLSAEPAS